ncbi:putative TBC1 domain family member 2A [Apostichopus japonicus]|uniref:Putative TBC1 domain family member 2A n=1 Tax=Stichopus japonicus TaxID=307972 RepID=A0A2G8LGP6_STIJA|nr:putative TBC1 domain family member 2A [Apostichopus japonicus]
MGIYWRGQVGVGHSQTRVQNRILLQPTFRGRRKADTHTHGPRQTLSPRRGNSGPAGQAGNYKSSGRDGTTLPVLLFSDQKTGRHLASHSKPKTPEHKTHQTKTLPYGDLKLNITPTQKGHVGGDRRLTGRLPAHLDTQRTPTIPSVPVRRTRLPVPGAPIRPSHGSQNLHESRGSSSRLPQKKRGHPLRISRRLVGSREQSIGSNQQRPQNAPDPSRTGLDREPEEITAITSQTIQFLGAILDFTTGVARPSEERVAAVKATTQQILAHRGSPTGTWLRALGLMASLVDIVRLCRLHMRPLQLHLLRSADPTDPDKTTLIYRSEEVTQHFRWWLDPNNWSSGVPFAIQLPMTSITTDASLSGWGAHGAIAQHGGRGPKQKHLSTSTSWR